LFTADRDVTYSYERLQPYFVVEGYGVTVSRQLLGRTDITAGVERHTYNYRDLLLPGAIAADRERVDITRTWLMTFGYGRNPDRRSGRGRNHHHGRRGDRQLGSKEGHSASYVSRPYRARAAMNAARASRSVQGTLHPSVACTISSSN